MRRSTRMPLAYTLGLGWRFSVRGLELRFAVSVWVLVWVGVRGQGTLFFSVARSDRGFIYCRALPAELVQSLSCHVLSDECLYAAWNMCRQSVWNIRGDCITVGVQNYIICTGDTCHYTLSSP